MTDPDPSTHEELGLDLLTFAFDTISIQDETKPIYIDAENPIRSLSAAQTRKLVRKLIAGLNAAGLEQGECVLVVLANGFWYSSIYFSIIGAGGVYLGANPTIDTAGLNRLIRQGQPKFIITSPAFLDVVAQASRSLEYLPSRVFILHPESFAADSINSSQPSSFSYEDKHSHDETTRGCRNLTSLLNNDEADWRRFQDVRVAKLRPAAMFLDSEADGNNRMVIHSHYAMVSQCLSLEAISRYEICRLVSLPYAQMTATLFAHIFPIRLGQPLYSLVDLQVEQHAYIFEQFGITDILIAPSSLYALYVNSISRPDSLKSLRWIGVNGVAVNAESTIQLRTLLHPSATLSPILAMAEFGVAILTQCPDQISDDSIGRPLPGFETRLVDNQGSLITSDNEPGELRVRYHGMMTGHKDQSPSQEGQWVGTGTFMTRCRGRYHSVGRYRDTMRVQRQQVLPFDLENVLLSHSCISDAAVINIVSDDLANGTLRAYIVRKPDAAGRCSRLSAADVNEWVHTQFAENQVHYGGCSFIDRIPRTISGEVDRWQLVQMDQYRDNITQLLSGNTQVGYCDRIVLEPQPDTQLKHNKTRSERGARSGSSRSESLDPVNATTATTSSRSQPLRRKRSSLLNKMKALKASQLNYGNGSPLSLVK